MKGTPEERFWAKVHKTETCWLWTGARIPSGYGSFWFDGHTVSTHRFAYELVVGPVPAEDEVDHLCRIRLCVNPAHLEPVSARENVLRSRAPAAFNAVKTHCPSGHEYSPDNTYTHGRKRHCRICLRVADAKRRPRSYA